jgi:hypothetical protein
MSDSDDPKRESKEFEVPVLLGERVHVPVLTVVRHLLSGKVLTATMSDVEVEVLATFDRVPVKIYVYDRPKTPIDVGVDGEQEGGTQS